jgi:ubiquitin-protein ligase
MYLNVNDINNNNFHIKLLLNVDPEIHPYYPPTIRYLEPVAKKSFIYNMSNLNILKLENWNPIINMDWLITNLADSIKDFIQEYIVDAKELDMTPLDKELIQFSSLISEEIYEHLNIELKHIKFSLKDKKDSNNKYWNSGVGYGHRDIDEWDVSKYVKEQEIKDVSIGESLDRIHKMICTDDNYSVKLANSSIIKFLGTMICNSTLLEINKRTKLFQKLMDLTKVIYGKLGDTLIEWEMNIHNSLEVFRKDISMLLSSIEDDQLEFYLSIISLADYIKSIVISNNMQVVLNEKRLLAASDVITIDKSVKDEYFEMIKSEQDKIFSDYIIQSNHSYSKYKTTSLNPKSIMRISSEFSSMRKNLPNNWDTSIVVRACSDNLNLFSFVIVGPKDTPYHNGIFEFHTYFPNDYPNKEPNVLLATTGNGSVRFNPNLYYCGKVCLSLLGTWSGQDGESWNKDTSTFLQVLVSIQSLILVENPYFNEPGWERQMHTQEGKKKSFEYTDNIRLQNLRWAIVDKFRNPPYGFETLTLNHFRLKKDEILEVVNSWIDETVNYKPKMTILRDELLSIYKELEHPTVEEAIVEQATVKQATVEKEVGEQPTVEKEVGEQPTVEKEVGEQPTGPLLTLMVLLKLDNLSPEEYEIQSQLAQEVKDLSSEELHQLALKLEDPPLDDEDWAKIKVEAEELPKDELHLHSLDIEELSVEELSSEYPIYKEPPLTYITEVNLDDINISSGSLPITTMLSDNLSSDKMSTKGFKGVFIDLTIKGILVSTLSNVKLLK